MVLECFAATTLLAKKRLWLLPLSNEMGLPKIGKPIRTVLRKTNCRSKLTSPTELGQRKSLESQRAW